MTDMINPNHYRGDRQYEPIAVIEDWGLNYRLGNAVKYISRNGRKPGEDPREGLRKAIWYLEREIASLDRPSQYVPFETSYEDVLEYYGQTKDLEEAWPEGEQPDYVTGGVDVFSRDVIESYFDDLWDPSLGPIEIDPKEVAERLSKKDLNQFDDDEIVSTVERRGMVIGFKKDGTSCVLKDGRCE